MRKEEKDERWAERRKERINTSVRKQLELKFGQSNVRKQIDQRLFDTVIVILNHSLEKKKEREKEGKGIISKKEQKE